MKVSEGEEGGKKAGGTGQGHKHDAYAATQLAPIPGIPVSRSTHRQRQSPRGSGAGLGGRTDGWTDGCDELAMRRLHAMCLNQLRTNPNNLN